MIHVRTSAGETLILNGKPLGKGGEGGVYRILSPLKYQHYCAKIYAEPKLIHQQKIDFMIGHPPDCLRQNLKMCWPTALIFDQSQPNKFLGYIMPMAFPASCSLQTLLTSGHRVEWSPKFNRDVSQGFRNSLSVAKNVALLVYLLHEIGDELNRGSGYVIGDLKPDNIMINANAQVSLIDMDSIQINARGMLYTISALSPEYSSPELVSQGTKSPMTTASDNFTLAIILYRILTGVHPFMGSVRGRSGMTLDESIKKGYYVFGQRAGEFEAIPSIHHRLNMASREVREFFRFALDAGLNHPANRPTASQWAQLLHEELRTNRFANLA